MLYIITYSDSPIDFDKELTPAELDNLTSLSGSIYNNLNKAKEGTEALKENHPEKYFSVHALIVRHEV